MTNSSGTTTNPVVDRLSSAGRSTYDRLAAMTDTELRDRLAVESSTAIGAVAVNLLDRLAGYKETLERVTRDIGGAARTSDPDTSIEAGEKARKREGSLARFKAGTHRHRLLAAYAAAGKPLHDHEAAVAAGIDRPDARMSGGRRQSELRKVGYITVTGDVAVDPSTGASGRMCEITPLGYQYLNELEQEGAR